MTALKFHRRDPRGDKKNPRGDSRGDHGGDHGEWGRCISKGRQNLTIRRPDGVIYQQEKVQSLKTRRGNARGNMSCTRQIVNLREVTYKKSELMLMRRATASV